MRLPLIKAATNARKLRVIVKNKRIHIKSEVNKMNLSKQGFYLRAMQGFARNEMNQADALVFTTTFKYVVLNEEGLITFGFKDLFTT